MPGAVAFEPRWASPTVDSVRRAISARGVPETALVEASGTSRDALIAFLNASGPMTMGIAKTLERALGGSASFWMTRDARFRERDEAAPATSLLDSIDPGSTRWLRDARCTLPVTGDRSLDLRSIFGDTRENNWRVVRDNFNDTAHFRTSSTSRTNPDAVAAWLLRCEHVARPASGQFSSQRLRSVLPDLRRTSRQSSVRRALDLMGQILSECGVALAVVQTPAECPVSGATWTDGSGRPVIALSGRYRSDDHLYFTLLHEIGHLLLHRDSAPFVDDLEQTDAEDLGPGEAEADEFAGEALGIHAVIAQADGVRLSHREIIRIAHHVGVSPGIVVGQLQRAGRLGYNERNGLKRRYKWDGITLENA